MQFKDKNIILIFLLFLGIFFFSCKKDGSDTPNFGYVNITINPNSTFYQEINFVGGWTYLGINDGVLAPSRGIIVYRLNIDQFVAFERTPPFRPDSCCNGSQLNCTRLVVEAYYPFVYDTCSESEYLIIDGSPVSGPSLTPLYKYRSDYDGSNLHIYN